MTDTTITSIPSGPVQPTGDAIAELHPLGHAQLALDPESWAGAWKARNRDCTLDHVLTRVENGEAYGNLAAVFDGSGRAYAGMPFTDSDVHKILEALAWAATDPLLDPTLLKRGQALVELLGRVQEEDGYLNSNVQVNAAIDRWADPQWGHELYCAGHLFQAAAAAARTGALPGLTAVATRLADLLATQFGPGTAVYVEGHPEVETALVELYRVTGERAYLDLAARQIELRGHGWLGGDRFGSSYFQDGVPVRSAITATGHAVRQLYLLTGAVDVAVETGDTELLAAVQRLWIDLFDTKTYVTGAHGSRHRDESIGDPYELPPDRAYAETCAAIASFQLNWRLLLATGEARYADEMETVLHNAIAVSTSLDGAAFFYSNPLQLRTGHDGSHEDAPSHRLPWFECACCPPNIARLLASLEDYHLTTSRAGVQVHLYSGCEVGVEVAGARVDLQVSTEYPFDGTVSIDVSTEDEGEWELALRVPSWCGSWRLVVDGIAQRAGAADGYVRVRRNWKGQHDVHLLLDMPVRTITPHPHIDAVRGCEAVARGPVLYALEQADVDVQIEDLQLVSLGPARQSVDPVVGPIVVEAEFAVADAPWDGPYRSTPSRATSGSRRRVALVPYHRWANRTTGAMRVWIPTS